VKKRIIYFSFLILSSFIIKSMEDKSINGKSKEIRAESRPRKKKTAKKVKGKPRSKQAPILPTAPKVPFQSYQQTIRNKIEKLIARNVGPSDSRWIKLLSKASCYERCADLIEIMLKRGVDPNIRNGCVAFDLPLYNSCLSGALKNVAVLLQYKANPNIASSFGTTPLIISVQKGYVDIVQLLLYNQINTINAQENLSDETALTVAVRGQTLVSSCYDKSPEVRNEVVILLLKAGADSSITNNDGLTAIDIARQNGFEDIAELIEEFEKQKLIEQLSTIEN